MQAQSPGQPFLDSLPISPDASVTLDLLFADLDGDTDLDVIEIKELALARVFLNDGAGQLVERSAIGNEQDDVVLTQGGVVVDVDNDSFLDLVVVNSGSPSRVYLGNGDGTFGTGADLDAASFDSRDIASADLDGNGYPDLVIANNSDTNGIYLNDGTGSFIAAGSVSADTFDTRTLVVADVSGDGRADLVEGNYLASDRVYLGTGAGGFGPGTSLPGSGETTFDLAVADLDGDGDLDVVEANLNRLSRYYLNTGVNTFVGFDLPGSNALSTAVGIGDANGDTFPDVLLGVFSGQNRLYLGDGAGNFTPGGSLGGAVDQTLAVSFVDLDGDFDEDIVEGVMEDVNNVYTNDPLGSFTLSRSFAAENQQTYGAALGDVDGDGDVDVVDARRFAANRLYINGGGAAFGEGEPVTEYRSTNKVLLVDVDRDGDLDIVEGNDGEGNRVYLNDGNGAFDGGADFGPQTDVVRGIAAADLNGDGWVDIVVANSDSASRFYLNDGAGGFPVATDLVYPGYQVPWTVAVGDLDGDTDVDIVIGNYMAVNRVHFNDGTGAFSVGTPFSADVRGTRTIVLADVDGDGDLDALAGNSFGGPPQTAIDRVYFNDGTGAFPTAVDLTPDADETFALAVGDVDTDGDLDVVVGNRAERNKLYLNDGSGAFAAGAPISTDILDTLWVGLGDADANGTLDLFTMNKDDVGRLHLNGNPTTSGLADVTVDEDSPPRDVDLHGAFDDLEDADAALTYDVVVNTDPGLVGTGILDGTLTLTFTADASGTADIRVRATDTVGLFVESEFQVTVLPRTDSPVVVAPIPDQTGTVGVAFSLDVSTAFADNDGDVLTYSLAGSPSLSINASGLISGVLSPADRSASPLSITVTADSNVSGETAASDTFVLTVLDTNAPSITILGQNPVTIVVGTVYVDAGAQASDQEDGDLTADIVVDNPVDASTAGQYTVTYTVTDSSANTASATRIVRVVTNPVVVAPIPDQTGTVGVAFALDVSGAFADADGDALTFSLAGSPSLTIDAASGLISGVLSPADRLASPLSIAVTANSNVSGEAAASDTFLLTVLDTNAPSITILGEGLVTIVAGMAYVDAGAQASDQEDGDLTAQIVVDNLVDTSTAGQYTVTYTVTDSSGNTATATRVVRVVADTAPTIVLKGANPLRLEGGSNYVDPGATATDLVDGDLTHAIGVNYFIDTTTPGVYTVTFTVKDSFGLTASATRTVQIVDTTAPVLTVLDHETVTLPPRRVYYDAGASARDAVDGDLTSQIVVHNPVNINVPREYEVTYTVTDASGNTATASRRVIVQADGGGGAVDPAVLGALLAALLLARRRRRGRALAACRAGCASATAS